MANKLQAEEFRTKLAQRGLSTSSSKPTLVRRLESAIREETIDLTDDSSIRKETIDLTGESRTSEKRKRESKEVIDVDAEEKDAGERKNERMVIDVIDVDAEEKVADRRKNEKIFTNIIDVDVEENDVGTSKKEKMVTAANKNGKRTCSNKGQGKSNFTTSPKTKLDSRIVNFMSLIYNTTSSTNLCPVRFGAYPTLATPFQVPAQVQEDTLCSHYKSLHCGLTPLEVDSEEFSMIATYLNNTSDPRYGNTGVGIVQIFRVSREGEDERFRKYSNTKNRMLLWHGSLLKNLSGILSQGLRAPESRGCFFADMFAKSAIYCDRSPAAVLVLCEVALGGMNGYSTRPTPYYNAHNSYYKAHKLPGEIPWSHKIHGTIAPDFSKVQTLKDGVVVPIGKPNKRSALQYNEYIVYDADQIRMRYVVQVKF